MNRTEATWSAAYWAAEAHHQRTRREDHGRAAGPAEQPAGRHDVRDHFDGEGGHDKLVDATGSGLRELVRRLRRAHVQEVVISPNQVHSLRGRYGSAGNKDDRFDAFVLADTLRTDRARLRPLIPDSLTGHRAARGVAAEEPDRWVSRPLRASPGQTGEAATSIGHAPATTGAAQRHDHDLRLEY